MANWLDKYEQGGLVLKKKTKDNYGKKANPNDVKVSVGPDFVGLGYNTKGRDYSPAWGGQFQDGGIIVNDSKDPRLKAYQDSLTAYNKSNDLYKQLLKQGKEGNQGIKEQVKDKMSLKEVDYRGSVGMPYSFEGIKPDYVLGTRTPEENRGYLPHYKKPIQLVEYQAPKAEVKKVKGSKKYFINETQVDESTFNQIVPKKEMAMGGGIPGAVGFTYARVAGSAPANGKYTKKTKASAQDGKKVAKKELTEEQYYNPPTPINKSGNTAMDMVSSNPWLMKVPILGNYIKDEAYRNAAMSQGFSTFAPVDTKQAEELMGKGYNAVGKYTGGGDEKYDLLKQYIYGDQNLQSSPYSPKDDYLKFLPSYSLKDKAGIKPQAYWKELILNNKYMDYSKDLENVVKTHKPKFYSQESDDMSALSRMYNTPPDLGHYKAGIGYDEDVNLPYVSVSDAWDFYPKDYQKMWSQSERDRSGDAYQQSYLMHKAGKPFKIYDRVYVDPKTKEPISDKEIIPKKLEKKFTPKGLSERVTQELHKGIDKSYNPYMQNGGEMAFYQNGLDFTPKSISKNGSVIKDDRGQWAHPGEITEIGSNNITMQGVDYPVLGVSDTGDTQIMQPNQDYKFDGEKVTEYPMMQEGGWLDKYPEPMRQDATRVAPPVLKLTEREKLENAAKYDQGQKKALVNAKEELAERKKNKATKGDLNTPGSWHTEDKARLSNILPASWAPPGGAVDVFDEYINPATYVGVLTDALGESVAARDPKGIATSLALSAGAGALGIDPLGSALKVPGKVAQSMESGLLSNAYKLNPYAFKPDSKAAYRMIGDEGYADALESGVIRAKQSAGKWNTQTGKIEMGTPNYEHPYFSYGKPWDKNLVKGKPWMGYKGPYMVELKNEPSLIENELAYSSGTNNIYRPTRTINTNENNLKLYKEHWLKGYKEVPKPTSTQQVTRGPINYWEEPGFAKRNPNFNPEAYANSPIGNPSAPRDIPKGMEPRLSKDKNGGWLNKYK